MTAGIEEQARPEPLEPAVAGGGLGLAEADGQLLVEVRRDLGGLPGVEQGESGLERGELMRAGGAGGDVVACSGVFGRGGLQQQIGQSGMAEFAVLVAALRVLLCKAGGEFNRRSSVQSTCCESRSCKKGVSRHQQNIPLDKLLQLLAQGLVGAEE